MAGRSVDPRFATRMRELLVERGMSYRALAARTFHGKSYLHELAKGAKAPTPEVARRIDDALRAGGELTEYATIGAPGVDELAALELSSRVTASDLSAETLAGLESAVDDLSIAYARTSPAQLLPRVRRHLAYVARLLDARKTLDQHRRLLIIGGWLEMLAATVHIDLDHRATAGVQLTTAREMAEHAGHPELVAWSVETRAWDVLTSGDYPRAVELSQQAQDLAPRGSSVHIQATAQEGRAWARMGRRAETLDALSRTTKLVSPLPVPEEPEHHYHYDPGKALAYTATTLSWVGDPAAEECAREVVRHMESGGDDGIARPRRAASARLDLGLALLAGGRPDEASAVAVDAITTGLVVPSNWWRATEILTAVEQAGAGEAGELRDAYHAYRPTNGA